MGLGAGDVKKCVAYGMITSDMGLLEIPHVPAPASVGDLHDAMRTQTFAEIAPFPIHFIPGVRNFAGPVDLDNFGMMDMMRGEETEAVGLFTLLEPETSAMFILPGSHNKFVSMSAEGKILGCMTSISGELLDAMTHHTILADAVGGAFVAPEAYDSRMAMEGAWACSQSGLGRAAFSRAHFEDARQAQPCRGAKLSARRGAGARRAGDGSVSAGSAGRNPHAGYRHPAAPQPWRGARRCAGHERTARNRRAAHLCRGQGAVQQAMIDVLEALGHEGAIAVPRELSTRMGVVGAAEIGL